MQPHTSIFTHNIVLGKDIKATFRQCARHVPIHHKRHYSSPCITILRFMALNSMLTSFPSVGNISTRL